MRVDKQARPNGCRWCVKERAGKTRAIVAGGGDRGGNTQHTQFATTVAEFFWAVGQSTILNLDQHASDHLCLKFPPAFCLPRACVRGKVCGTQQPGGQDERLPNSGTCLEIRRLCWNGQSLGNAFSTNTTLGYHLGWKSDVHFALFRRWWDHCSHSTV